MARRKNVDVSVEKCQSCAGKCCRYVALEIDKPRSKADFDDIRWYVAHKDVSVFIEDGGWYINFEGECQYLAPDMRCTIYEHKPNICTDHPQEECEESDGEPDRIDFNTPAEVEEFMARRFRRGQKKRS